MKKTTAFILILICSFSFIFAEDPPAPVHAFDSSSIGFASREYRTEYGLFCNPAYLANSKTQFLLGLDTNVFNIGNFLAKADFNSELLNLAVKYADGISIGEGRIASIQASSTFAKNSFACAGFINADIDVNKEGALKISVWPVVDAGFAVGFAKTIKETEKAHIEAGISAHADASLATNYSLDVDVSKIEDILKMDISEEAGKLIDSLCPVVCFSFDIGAKYVTMDDRLSVHASMSDIPLYKNIALNENYDISEIPSQKPNLCFGIILNSPDSKPLHSSVSADLVNINSIENLSKQVILTHLNLRAALDFSKKIKLSAAINGGDVEFDAGLNLFGNEMDIIYKVNEFGEEVGENTVDSLSVRVRIGIDKN